jgi:glycosyltransferase involved in cell wall biosynthesis
VSPRGSYVVVTPARNEAALLPRAVDSVAAQTRPPAEWILVDDGSRDATAALAESARARVPSLRVLRAPDRGRDAVGAGVVEAFERGLAALRTPDWDYVVKLDADVSLEPDYFARLLERMDAAPRLGIASGQNYLPRAGRAPLVEEHAAFHPVGGARAWRRACFEQIGGLVRTPGWDTLDLIRARMRGWDTRCFDDLVVLHHRDMSTRRGAREGIRRLGRICYLLGYDPLYFALRCLYRLRDAPLGLRSLYLVEGFAGALVTRAPRIVTDDERRWLRSFQRGELVRRVGGGR